MFRKRKHGTIAVMMVLAAFMTLAALYMTKAAVRIPERKIMIKDGFQTQCVKSSIPEFCSALMLSRISGWYAMSDSVVSSSKIQEVRTLAESEFGQEISLSTSNPSAGSLHELQLYVPDYTITISGFRFSYGEEDTDDIYINTDSCTVAVSHN